MCVTAAVHDSSLFESILINSKKFTAQIFHFHYSTTAMEFLLIISLLFTGVLSLPALESDVPSNKSASQTATRSDLSPLSQPSSNYDDDNHRNISAHSLLQRGISIRGDVPSNIQVTTYASANCQGNPVRNDEVVNGKQYPINNPSTATLIKSMHLSRDLGGPEHIDYSTIPQSMMGSIHKRDGINTATACSLYHGSFRAGAGGCVTPIMPATCYEFWPT